MPRSQPGRRPGEWRVPMPRGVGPEEWSQWFESYQAEVAATGRPHATEEVVCGRFGGDVELVDLRVKGVGGPPLWAVRQAAQGVRAVESWLKGEGFAVRRAARAGEELGDLLARLESPGLLPDLIIGERHAFFLEVRRTSVTTAGHYSRVTGAGELALDAARVRAFEAAEETTGMPVFVLFIDEPLRRVYGNWLAELTEPRSLLQGKDRVRAAYPRLRHDRGRGQEVICFPYPAAFRPLGTVTSGRRFRLARGAEHDRILIQGRPEF
ncbi:MAG: hypothetical protein ACYC5Y_04685 [Symbiobacteriia bacterium]